MIFKKHELARLSSAELTTLKELLPDLVVNPLTGEAVSKLADKYFPALAFSDAVAKLRETAIKSTPATYDQAAARLREHQRRLEALPQVNQQRQADRKAELAEVAKHVPWAASALVAR